MPSVVQHTIHVAAAVDVDFKVPHAPPQKGEDSIHVTFDGSGISMKRNDWQQFVNCVIAADKQVRELLDVPGRPIGGQAV